MSTLQEIARLVREELLTLIRPVQLMSVNPSKATGEVSGRFKSNGILFDYSIKDGSVVYRPMGAGGNRADAADFVVTPGIRSDAARGKPRNCSTGYACGNTCIQKGRKCRAQGGAAAKQLSAIVKYGGEQPGNSASTVKKPASNAAAATESSPGNGIDTEIARLQALQKKHVDHANSSGHHPSVLGNEVIRGLQALKEKKEGKSLRWQIHGKTYQIPETKLKGLSPREVTSLIYTRVTGSKPGPGQAFGSWFEVPNGSKPPTKAAPDSEAPARGSGKAPSTGEVKAAVLKTFGVKSAAELKRNEMYQMAMTGSENPLKTKEDWLKVYRQHVRVPDNERNLPDAPTVVNGIDVTKNFRPWAVFKLDPKTATNGDIRSAFRKLILKHHPDQGGDPRVAERLKKMRDSLLALRPDDRKPGSAGKTTRGDSADLLEQLVVLRQALRNSWSSLRWDGYDETMNTLVTMGRETLS